VPTDDEWDVPTDVVPPTWIAAAEEARRERAALQSIEREQLRELGRPPTAPPVAPARSRR
jgi:hypothetical protein